MALKDRFYQPRGPSGNTLFLLKSKFFRASSTGKRVKEPLMQTSETELMLKGYGLTTAEFFYRMPDYTHVLNSYIWQDYDIAPDHPRLFEFVEYWQSEIEGPLHSVRFTHRKLIAPGEWRNQVGEFHIH
jgi:uncharacterized protein Usg